MKRSVKNLILAMLMGSALLIAGLSASANSECYEIYSAEIFVHENISVEYHANDAHNHNSDFWDKFRESVMPDERNQPEDHRGNESHKEPPHESEPRH